MPVYAYHCTTCGADIELLHGVGKDKSSCGLGCRRRDSGPFGKGVVERRVTAANVVARRAIPTSTANAVEPSVPPEAMRRKALERLGDRITEGEIAKAKKGGLTVYRNAGAGTFVRDGGDRDLPKRIRKPQESQ